MSLTIPTMPNHMTTKQARASDAEVSEIERGAKFVLQRMERDTTPVSQEYSLASIAASLKRLADQPVPHHNFELTQLKDAVTGVVSAINAQTHELGRTREELTRSLRHHEQIMLQITEMLSVQQMVYHTPTAGLTPPERA